MKTYLYYISSVLFFTFTTALFACGKGDLHESAAEQDKTMPTSVENGEVKLMYINKKIILPGETITL